MKLGEIAEIGTGLVLTRKKAESEKETAKIYNVITLRSINNQGYVDRTLFEIFESREELGDNYISKKGDIIIRLSEPNTAILIGEEDEGLLISSQFCLIRIKGNKFLPEYISWYLNSSYAKKEISKSMIGSTLGIIKTSFLNELEIPKIPMEKQRIITEINLLKKIEKALMEKLIEEKNKLYEITIKKIFEGDLK